MPNLIIRHVRRFLIISIWLMLLFVIVIGARSYWAMDLLSFDADDGSIKQATPTTLVIRSNAGVLSIEYVRSIWADDIPYWVRRPQHEPEWKWGFLSFAADRNQQFSANWPRLISTGFSNRYKAGHSDFEASPDEHVVEFWIPHWVLASLLGLPCLIWLGFAITAIRRRLRIIQRRCPTCDYDLRASPERCPECGTEVKPPMDAGERR